MSGNGSDIFMSDYPLLVDHEGFRHPVHAIVDGQLAFEVTDMGKRGAIFLEILLRVGEFVLIVYPEHDKVGIVFKLSMKLKYAFVFHFAFVAPGSPKIQQDHFAFVLIERNGQ